jgi:phage terminase small subunit
MTHKQTLFTAEYIKTGNATEAAKAAGYSPKTAYSIGQRLLKKVEVKQAIQECQEKASREAEVTLEWWVKKMKQLADFDPRRFYDAQGNLLPVPELDDDSAAALAGLEVQEMLVGLEGGKQVTTVKRVKFTDRQQALNMLGKHLGAYFNELTLITKLSDTELDALIAKLGNRDTK